MATTQRLCVHAHFYQPSRKDLSTGQIPLEEGAWPFQNWNERIYLNCYKPNAELGNFSKISFNIGPTLSEWMREHHSETLKQIVESDQQNVIHFGVGNAMAQPYHHTILPLAKRRDKETQVRWGIAEFELTFGRKPQGMWLPETAVDMETLEVLAQNGIEFTILAPWQAAVHDVDPRKAYQVILPGHQSMKVFFYHSGLSSRVSFDPNSTINADQFIRDYVRPEFSGMNEDQWLMLASDGELYGHHQVFRDKFLSYLLNGSLSGYRLDYSFPALQLMDQRVFPIMKIHEKTSWSCHHGVQRWAGVCACTPNSEWKKHLREALDCLNFAVEAVFIEKCQGIINDPWKARNEYIEVIIGRSIFEKWLESQTLISITEEEKLKFKWLFQAMVDAQSMFTSCGWFFEDFDRIEPRNNVISAAHSVWLISQATGIDLVDEICPFLERVKSWRTGLTAFEVFIQALKRFNQLSC